MTNNRLFYAIEAVGIKPDGNTGAYTVVHGAQSATINTTFNLERILELGQQEIYENIEDVPDVELSIEKVIDGYPLIYHLATPGAATDTLSGRSAIRCIAAMSLFREGQDSASGTPITTVEMSGLYVSSLSYTLPVEGSCTESVTLVGNNKVWRTGGATLYGTAFAGSLFDNTDEPLAFPSSGGVQRRENVIFGLDESRLPTEIPGLDVSGHNIDVNGKFGAAVQNITISTDLGREELLELGRKGPYFRYVNFPVDVNTEIEIISKSGDLIDALESEENITNQTIYIKLEEGSIFDLGSRNKLQSTSMGGGSTGGEPGSVTYSYTGNTLTVSHPQAP